MQKLSKTLGIGIMVILLACSGQVEQTAPNESEAPLVAAPAEPVISSEKTKEVVEHHLASFGQNDLEAVLSDYTEESIIITPDGTLKGLDQIRPFFVGLFEGFPTEGTAFEMDNMTIALIQSLPIAKTGTSKSPPQ